MYLHDGRVHFDRFDLDAHYLFPLQTLEDMIQNTVLGPAIHTRVNGMPRAETPGQAAPLATLLSHIEQGVEKLQVGHPHIAALARQLRLHPLKLRLGDLHLLTISRKLN